MTPTRLKHMVRFESVGDIADINYNDKYFDVIIARDTLMHHENKVNILRRLHRSLKPGGRILMTDYCRMQKFFYTQDFIDYAEDWDYYLITILDQKQLMRRVGFKDIIARDETDMFVQAMKDDLERFKARKDEIVMKYSMGDFQHLQEAWMEKLDRCEAEDQTWGVFTAKKIFE